MLTGASLHLFIYQRGDEDKPVKSHVAAQQGWVKDSLCAIRRLGYDGLIDTQ